MKELLNSLSWIHKSFLLTASMALFPIFVTFLAKRGIKPEVTVCWWALGAAISMYVLARCDGGGLITATSKDFTGPIWAIVLITVLGATLGLIINTFYGQVMSSAPNPMLAMSIVNTSVALGYLLAPLLHKWFPQTFAEAEISWRGFGGVVLIILGGLLITSKGK